MGEQVRTMLPSPGLPARGWEHPWVLQAPSTSPRGFNSLLTAGRTSSVLPPRKGPPCCYQEVESCQAFPGKHQHRKAQGMGRSVSVTPWTWLGGKEAPSQPQPPYHGLTVNPTPTPREGEPVKDSHISGRAAQSSCWKGGINPNCLRFLAKKKSLCILHICWLTSGSSFSP